MNQEKAIIERHEAFGGEYRLLVVRSARIAAEARPGQFAHLRVTGRSDLTLRRPLSISRAEAGLLHFIYKPVGIGTGLLAACPPGAEIDLLGPLGNGFPLPQRGGPLPVLVAGGYGMAPLFFLAQRSPEPGKVFLGGRGSEDILNRDEFAALGWDVNVTTDDGSMGEKGQVTTALDKWINKSGYGLDAVLYSCGPQGLLRAVAERARRRGWTAWLSMERKMGCAMGACLTCVLRIHADNGWAWKRVCRDGPVFEARRIIWDDEAVEGPYRGDLP